MSTLKRLIAIVRCRKPSRTTPIDGTQAQSFLVTHPFHPLTGRQLAVARFCCYEVEDRVSFHDEQDRICEIPLSWTSLATEDPFVILAAAIVSQVEAARLGITKEIWILVPLVRNRLQQHLLLGEPNAVCRSRQHDVAARRVIVPCDGEIQDLGVLGVDLVEDGGPACISPQRIFFVLGPLHQVVAARQPDTAALIQSVPSPVTKAARDSAPARTWCGEIDFPLMPEHRAIRFAAWTVSGTELTEALSAELPAGRKDTR